MSAPIRVLIADDHAVVRGGLSALLTAAGFEVVGAAVDGADAVRLVEELAPDLVLMDLSMPVLDGIEATRQILAGDSPSRIVALTSFAERDRVLAAIGAGCWGYLLKDSEPDELIRSIRAAASGGAPFDPRVAGVLLEALGTPPTTAGLTPREREVLQLVAGGRSNKEIARALGISEKTVKAHMTSIFHRLGVDDRTQAALWAREHGLP